LSLARVGLGPWVRCFFRVFAFVFFGDKNPIARLCSIFALQKFGSQILSMGVDEFERSFRAQNFLVGMKKAEKWRNCVRHKTDRTLSRKKKKKKKKKALNLR
jgi:hypothetical protein